MKLHWRKLAALLPLSLEKKVYAAHFQSLHNRWEEGGGGFPPSHLWKQKLIRQIASQNDLHCLVETGTYLGDMIYAMQDEFDVLYSIELSPHFYKMATKRFAGYRKVTLLEGDSGEVLKTLVPQIKSSALFWLDGHYSGGLTAKGAKECPIFEELRSVFSSPFRHLVVIDDARLFVGKQDYPTIDELKAFVATQKPGIRLSVDDDAIILQPVADA